MTDPATMDDTRGQQAHGHLAAAVDKRRLWDSSVADPDRCDCLIVTDPFKVDLGGDQ